MFVRTSHVDVGGCTRSRALPRTCLHRASRVCMCAGLIVVCDSCIVVLDGFWTTGGGNWDRVTPSPSLPRKSSSHSTGTISQITTAECCSAPPKRAPQGCEGRWCVRAPLWATRTSACTAPRVGAVHTCSSLRACVFGRPIGRGVCACLCLHSRVSQRECCGVSCASRSQRVRTHGPLCHARAPTRVVVRHSVRCVREGAGCGSARTQARALSSFTRSF